MSKAARFALLIPGGVALIAGSIAALALLGVSAPGNSEQLMASHGVLMVLGFVGTVIALERAVALGAVWGFGAPASLGFGAVALLTQADPRNAALAFVAGTVWMLIVYGALLRRNLAPETVVQALGAMLAAGGAVIWLGGAPVSVSLPWWVGFVVLTIAGERAELARIESPRMGAHTLRVASALVVAVLAATLWPTIGGALIGAVLLVLVGVLVATDVARRLIRATGMPRFASWAMLAGYVWLAVAGGVWLVASPIQSGPAYDAAIHAAFLGFTMSMIMAHAPMIMPALLRIALPYVPVMYGPLVVLHVSLVIRLVGGDAYGVDWALTVGGVLNIVAVIAFALTAVGTAVWAAIRSRRSVASPQAPVPENEEVSV